MKNPFFIVSLIIASFLNAITAQESYYEFPFEGWKQTYTSSTWTGVYWQENVVTLQATGDSIVNGKNYLSWGSELYRYENGKVISYSYIHPTGYEEVVRFDFTLQPGDYFSNDYFPESDSLKVISKERIVNLNQDSVWQLKIERYLPWQNSRDTLTWLEGVGETNLGFTRGICIDCSFHHSCTSLANNVKLYNNPQNTSYCNCSFLYGEDMDNDGYGNYQPKEREVFVGWFFSGSDYVKEYKARNCDTLIVIDEYEYTIFSSDEYCNGDLVDYDSLSVTTVGSSTIRYSYYFYDVSKYDKLYLTDECSRGFAVIYLHPCFENDCDDTDPDVYNGELEIEYNGKDDDCDPSTLDDDLDQDGFVLSEDCDDQNAAINPAAVEIPYNMIDEDCDPSTLDDDLDQDGFVLSEDCDDQNAAINPDAVEIPYNMIDEDCDPSTLDDDFDQDGFVLSEDCDDQNAAINPDAVEIPYNMVDEDCNPATLDDDLDQDGFVLSEDCDDTDPDINPDAVDIPNNGIDENCDGEDLISNTKEVGDGESVIYPNPSNGMITIGISGAERFDLKAIALNGQQYVISDAPAQIDLSFLADGIYFIEIYSHSSKHIFTTKLLITR